MIVRSNAARTIPSFLLPCFHPTQFVRHLHRRIAASHIPQPTPFVPDAQTFLTLIGRGLSKHAAKIPSWDALFSLTSPQLKELGIEPPRTRRYLLRWLRKFRLGEYGVGGDLTQVTDGVAELRVAEVPAKNTTDAQQALATATQAASKRKVVVNVPKGTDLSEELVRSLKPVRGLQVKGASTIIGSFVQPVKGTRGMIGTIAVKEGMWEDRRGQKVDGGERRKAEVRYKRRAEERKASRA